MMSEAEMKHNTRPMSRAAVMKEHGGVDEKMPSRIFDGISMDYMGTYSGYIKAVGASFGFFCHLRPKMNEDKWRTVRVLHKGDTRYKYRLYMKVK